MRKAITLSLTLLLVASLAGCTSLEDYLDKNGVLKIYVVGGGDALGDFRNLEIMVQGLVIKDATSMGRAPEYVNASLRIDLTAARAPYQLHELKLPIGAFNVTAVTIQVTDAILKNGTRVPVDVRDTRGPGVYAPRADGGPDDIAAFSIDRAKETHVKVGFVVKHDTQPRYAPHGRHYIDWSHTDSGPFKP